MQGEYDTTTCIDVLIHYPQEKMDDMVWHTVAPNLLSCSARSLSSSACAHSSLRRGLSLSLPLVSRSTVPSLPRKRADRGRREPPHQVGHLCSISKKRFIISFAPYTLYYAALKQLGSLAPGPSKATRAYLHKEADVVAALEKRGFKVKRSELTATNFYFSKILEAVKE